MAIFAGNLSCKFSFDLVLLIPWVKKNNAISFPNCRAYNSSFPVRYIPKQSIKVKESETMKGSKEKESNNCSDSNALRFEVSHSERSARRTFVFDDKSRNQNQIPMNNFTFDAAKPESKEEIEEIDRDLGVIDYELMEEPEEVVEEVEIHWGKDCCERNVSQAGKTKQDAEKLAVELLATRAFTAVELRTKLHGKRFPPDIIEEVITNFQSRGLINDCLYAETFSRSRWSSSSWGPRRIKQALFKKGVSEVDAEHAVKLVFEDGESGGDQESRLGLSKLSMDHLFVQASKQWLRGRDVPGEKRKSRLIRWLQYRGFNWGVISFILKKLESQYPP